MARRWQAEATARVPVEDPGSEASMTGREQYTPEISVHVRAAWPPNVDPADVENACITAMAEAFKAIRARAERGGR